MSICWTWYKRNVPVEILPYWSVKYELSFSDATVYRNDRILVSAALHAKDPDYQMKLRIWAKVQPLGVPQHLHGDQRWKSNWCSSLIHVKSATLSRLRTKLQTLVKSWVWYFWVDQGTLSGFSWLLRTCHRLAPGLGPRANQGNVSGNLSQPLWKLVISRDKSQKQRENVPSIIISCGTRAMVMLKYCSCSCCR